MENKYFIDDLAYDEAECEEKYDHKYLGQEGLRELIGIVKYQLRELDSISDEHDLRLRDLENAVAIIEAKLKANDKRLDEFAVDIESSEPLTIEQAVDAILQYARDIDSVELGSEVLSVQDAFDLVEDQIADVESDLQEQIDELGSEFDGVLEELEDSVVKSIEYNGESFKPEDIYDKPQPEDKDLGYEESGEGFVVAGAGVHYIIKAISNGLKYTKELDKCILEYDFGAKCLDEHDFVNIDGFGFKLTLGDEVVDIATGLKDATEVGELDEHNFFISDTLKSAGVVEIERSEQAVELNLVWQLETPPLEDPTEVLQLVYTLEVPAFGDDVYRENVVTIPTDIDLSDAIVRVGEGSEEEKKTLKEAVDDLHQAIADEEEARKSEDAELQEELDQLDGEAVKVVKVAGEPLEKDSEGAVNIERADSLMVEAGEDHQLIDQTIGEHLNALYNEDKALSDEIEDLKESVEDLGSKAVEGIEYKGEVFYPEETSEGNIVDLKAVSDDIQEILDEIGKIIQISYQVVEELPETGEPGVIYLIRIESSEGDNIYEEYIFLGEGSEGHFELIGSTRVDLGDIYEKLDELKERLDNFNDSGEAIEDNFDELNDSISSLEDTVSNISDAVDDLNSRFDDFDGSGETIEEVINDLVDQLNTQLETIIERIDNLEDLIQSGVVSDVAVNNVLLEKDSEGKVNIPLVSQTYDGVVPKYTGVPDGYLQDGDIVLVLRNNVPTWTEVDIYNLGPEPTPEPNIDVVSVEGLFLRSSGIDPDEGYLVKEYEAGAGHSFTIVFNTACDFQIQISPEDEAKLQSPLTWMDTDNTTLVGLPDNVSGSLSFLVSSVGGQIIKIVLEIIV